MFVVDDFGGLNMFHHCRAVIPNCLQLMLQNNLFLLYKMGEFCGIC